MGSGLRGVCRTREAKETQPDEREFLAIGLAGQALIHDQRNEIEPLSDKLTDVWEDRIGWTTTCVIAWKRS